ncbi:Serine/Threonine kinase domain protein (macronuclear) [Tetrahymena thermophila SB210]|uniref:non-specific serine/threonine protein kinase n=1 Tax=Tetrahymena thermophila (strain SB210) TaxID=312017 RepID=I7MAZ3_TETTS|nr:Serine/Threonine kinase domain protein [Tetrahymena thermophila SB210]EAS06769.2 Serine/Threonine kinase domain protein [Tetrahymena thermophila SB210]|eukprot:XP_001027011.2 Serine/Threonine kinase domain protein [Tetrahymena thermophila SB210]
MGCSSSISTEVSSSEKKIKRIQNQKVIKQLSWDKNSNQDETTIASIENIEFFYEFIKQIGQGQFGSVFLAKRRKQPFDEVAIKIINLNQIKKIPLQYIKREVQISKSLDHPNIIKFQETYIDKKNIYIVMEYCTGGNLSQKQFSEQEVLNIMKKLLYAVNYMHKRNIIHRDLKLENILYERDSPDSEIKIIDFGLSKQVPKEQKARRHSIVGSETYMAPEVLSSKNYDKSCDVWSLGVIMYRLLSGELPFKQRQQILDGLLIFKSPIWSSVSRDAFDLLKKMVNVYPQYRITIDQALKHSWFQQRRSTVQISQLIQLQPGHLLVLNKFQLYDHFSQFKKEILQMYVKRYVSKDQELNYRKLFKSIDSENKGIMTKQQIDETLQKLGIDKQQQEVNKTAQNNSQNQINNVQVDDTVEYSEFLAGCVGQDLVSSLDKLKNAFGLIDVDSKSKITQQDIEAALQREGRQFSKEKLQSLIEEIDTYFDAEKKMDFQGFCACLGFNQQGKQTKKINQQDQINESDEEEDSDESENSKSVSEKSYIEDNKNILQKKSGQIETNDKN